MDLISRTNVGDTISRQAAIDAVHSAVIDFFDFVEDDSESPITHHDEQLLSLNKAITTKIKHLPSVERKTGKWISVYTGKPVEVINGVPRGSCKCSVCGKWLIASDEYIVNGNFCPYCGSFNGGEE